MYTDRFFQVFLNLCAQDLRPTDNQSICPGRKLCAKYSESWNVLQDGLWTYQLKSDNHSNVIYQSELDWPRTDL